MVPNGTCVATRDMAMANDSSLYAYYTAAVEWSHLTQVQHVQ